MLELGYPMGHEELLWSLVLVASFGGNSICIARSVDLDAMPLFTPPCGPKIQSGSHKAKDASTRYPDLFRCAAASRPIIFSEIVRTSRNYV